MTPEQQRIAIAEACGWVWYRIPKLPSKTREHRALFHPQLHEYPEQSDKWKVRADGTERICNMDYMAREGHVPNYLNDLNAMHEAIRDKIAGNQELELRFIKELHAIQYKLADSEDVTPICEHEMVDIISECRWLAEAFLRTFNKWVD